MNFFKPLIQTTVGVMVGIGAICPLTQYSHPPPERLPYANREKIEFNKELLTIIGVTGHHLKTIEDGLFEKNLYYVPVQCIKDAQHYASRNGRNNGAVAVLAAKNPSKLLHDEQHFEGPYSPMTPDSMKKAGMAIVSVIFINEKNDHRIEACLKRALSEKGGNLPRIVDFHDHL